MALMVSRLNRVSAQLATISVCVQNNTIVVQLEAGASQIIDMLQCLADMQPTYGLWRS